MRLLITANGNSDREGYQTITSYNSFRRLAALQLHKVREIRVESLLLGISCIMWVVDNKKSEARHIVFVNNLKNPHEAHMLKHLLLKVLK